MSRRRLGPTDVAAFGRRWRGSDEPSRPPRLLVAGAGAPMAELAAALATAAGPSMCVERVDDLVAAVAQAGDGADTAVLTDASGISGPLSGVVTRFTCSPGAPPLLIVGCADDDTALAAVRAGAHEASAGPMPPVDALLHAVRCAVVRHETSGAWRAQAVTDALTGLPNRLGLLDRLDHAIATSRRQSRLAAVLFIDLDGFKGVNDTWGHAAGDRVLVEVARRLAAKTRHADTVARLGGDEFVVVMEQLDDAHHASTMASKILDLVSQPVALDGRTLTLSASIGISLCPDDGIESATMLCLADAAMYAVKAEGKHGYRYHSAPMHEAAHARTRFETAIARSVDAGELELHYQPRWHAGERRVSGCEALLRWRRDGLGLVTPAEMLARAEGSDAIVAIGRWVTATACRDARRLRDAGFEVPVSVNVSPRQLAARGFAHDLGRHLRDWRVPAGALALEIPERLLVDMPSAVREVLADVHALGVPLVVEHFGTGCSSLASLSTLPISALKIDGSLVRDLTRHTGAAAMPAAVIAVGRSLGLDVMADGVETDEHARRLQALGCEQLQGFYYGQAMPADELLSYLRWAMTAVVGSDGPMPVAERSRRFRTRPSALTAVRTGGGVPGAIVRRAAQSRSASNRHVDES